MSGKPVSYAHVTSVLKSQGIPYKAAEVQSLCDGHSGTTHMGSLTKMCGCGSGKPILGKYDCGCGGGKPKLPGKY